MKFFKIRKTVTERFPVSDSVELIDKFKEICMTSATTTVLLDYQNPNLYNKLSAEEEKLWKESETLMRKINFLDDHLTGYVGLNTQILYDKFIHGKHSHSTRLSLANYPYGIHITSLARHYLQTFSLQRYTRLTLSTHLHLRYLAGRSL